MNAIKLATLTHMESPTVIFLDDFKMSKDTNSNALRIPEKVYIL
jgi:hypothetical protein